MVVGGKLQHSDPDGDSCWSVRIKFKSAKKKPPGNKSLAHLNDMNEDHQRWILISDTLVSTSKWWAL